MDIIDKINRAEYIVNNRAIDKKGYMQQLSFRNYETIYKLLKNKRSTIYVDENNEVNFLIKLNKIVDIKEILYYKKSLDVRMDLEGPILELIVDGLDSFQFLFSLNDVMGILALKYLFLNRAVNVHFVVELVGTLQKFYSSTMPIDEKVIERVEYVLKCLDEYSYPKIEEDIINKESILFEIEAGYEVLEDLINIVDNLRKWNSKDSFSIAVSREDNFKVYFVGHLLNKNYIKEELKKKYSIHESSSVSMGKKFLKYDKGMLYFYN
ncbi:MAG: hypothetical protein N2Z71_02545 [Caloramator sp.]|nr:hypothetical protein [Caloramator sp.]